MLVGINLLREGLDIPECGLVAILDADKEGFLRSETSLIQTIGRAARNVEGRVILYADTITGSIERALAETDRRREKQLAYNAEHGITPESDQAQHPRLMAHLATRDGVVVDTGDEERPHLVGHNLKAYIADLEERMRKAAADLEFEEAARLRDEIRRLEEDDLGIPHDERVAPRPLGNSTEGKPGTRKGRFGKQQRTRFRRPRAARPARSALSAPTAARRFPGRRCGRASSTRAASTLTLARHVGRSRRPRRGRRSPCRAPTVQRLTMIGALVCAKRITRSSPVKSCSAVRSTNGRKPASSPRASMPSLTASARFSALRCRH